MNENILRQIGISDAYITGDDLLKIRFALKLQELTEERIKPLNIELNIIAKTEHGIKSCGSDYHLKILNERNYYQTLLKESEQ